MAEKKAKPKAKAKPKKRAKRKVSKSDWLVKALKQEAQVREFFGKKVGKKDNRRVVVELPYDLAELIAKGPFHKLYDTHPVEAVEADLALIAEKSPALAASSLAATALQLAREIASPRNSATSKAMCSREIRETITKLWQRADAIKGKKKDSVDELNERREQRRAAGE